MMTTFRERMILLFGAIGGATGILGTIAIARGDLVAGSVVVGMSMIVGSFGLSVHR